MHLYRHSRGELFLAFLTWRAGINKIVLRRLPALQDGGFRAKRTSKMLCELHSLKYDGACLEYEYKIKRKKANPMNTISYEPLGDFSNKNTWPGTAPTAGYLDHAQKEYYASIMPYLNKSVKNVEPNHCTGTSTIRKPSIFVVIEVNQYLRIQVGLLCPFSTSS